MQLPEILLTRDKAFQSIAGDKGLKMQILGRKNVLPPCSVYLDGVFKKVKRHKAPEELLLRMKALKKEIGKVLPSSPVYLGLQLQTSECTACWIWINNNLGAAPHKERNSTRGPSGSYTTTSPKCQPGISFHIGLRHLPRSGLMD